MKKNPHGRILKKEHKKQYLSTVPKSYSSLILSCFHAKLIFKHVKIYGVPQANIKGKASKQCAVLLQGYNQ